MVFEISQNICVIVGKVKEFSWLNKTFTEFISRKSVPGMFDNGKCPLIILFLQPQIKE